MSSNSSRLTLRSLLDLMSSGAVIVAAAALVHSLYRNADGTSAGALDPQVPSEPVAVDGAPVRGSERAETIVIVYSDFQCPFCARFARDVLPELERRYLARGQVAMAFRHLPLDIHPLAVPAAISAECAGRQNQFWEMHDQLFAVGGITEEVLQTLPRLLGLDMAAFDKCLKDDSVRARVQASVDEAGVLGIRATPTFLLGTRLADGRIKVTQAIAGARSIDAFVKQLDSVLQRDSATAGLWRRLFS